MESEASQITRQINKAIAARDVLNKTLNDLLTERDALGYTDKIRVLQDKEAILSAVHTLLDEKTSVALILVEED